MVSQGSLSPPRSRTPWETAIGEVSLWLGRVRYSDTSPVGVNEVMATLVPIFLGREGAADRLRDCLDGGTPGHPYCVTGVCTMGYTRAGIADGICFCPGPATLSCFEVQVTEDGRGNFRRGAVEEHPGVLDD